MGSDWEGPEELDFSSEMTDNVIVFIEIHWKKAFFLILPNIWGSKISILLIKVGKKTSLLAKKPNEREIHGFTKKAIFFIKIHWKNTF